MKPMAFIHLEPREVKALALLANGATSDAIARRLGLRPNTTRTLLTHIYDRLGVNSGAAAVAQALARGILDYTDVKPPKPKNRYTLTPVEREVLSWCARGLGPVEIGIRMKLSRQTITFHLRAIRTRFEVDRNEKAIAIAKGLSLLDSNILSI